MILRCLLGYCGGSDPRSENSGVGSQECFANTCVCVVSDKLFDVTELIFSFMELEVIFIFLLYPNRLYVVKEMSSNYVL